MAEKKSRVDVHSKLTVVSSRPTGPGKTHPLSALDHAMGRHTLHLVFYYRTNPFLDTDLTSLRVSLSELLCSYPPVTGRLAARRPPQQAAEDHDGDSSSNWMVKCNDAGVRMLRAKVGTTLDEWLRFADGSEERDLTVWEDMPDDPSIWSPFCIQINDFEGGGLAIGLSCTHMHADQTSATILVKSWAELHRGQPISHPPLFHRPTPPLPPPSKPPSPNTNTTKLAQFYANKQSKAADHVPSLKKMATATFRFPDSTIKQRLSEIHVKWPGATPFDLLAALFWTRIVKLKSHFEQSDTHNLSICIDFRRLIHPPLPFGYFGNALHFSQVSLDTDALLESREGLEHVAGLVHDHVSGLEEEEFWSVSDWFESNKLGEELKQYGPELTCVSLEHLIVVSDQGAPTCESLMYDAMFTEGEKPVHVSYRVGNVEGEGLITIMPSSEGGGLGRTVMVTLPEEQIGKLCEDQAMLALKPTRIMNGEKDDSC